MLERQGIIPGIKVDQGAKPLALAPGETITEGLDGLRERFAEYRELGARFAKWRAVIAIGDGIPSEYCVWANAHALARYAALAQEAGLVPIVEPEVLMDGDHTIDRSYAVTSHVQHAVFTELHDQRVPLEGMLLKPNMVLSGYDCPEQAGRRRGRRGDAPVPAPQRAGGGARDRLPLRRPDRRGRDRAPDAINRLGPQPWELSFSFGRALQAPAQQAWAGQDANVAAAQAAYLKRARLNGAARSGAYDPGGERPPRRNPARRAVASADAPRGPRGDDRREST